jgi:hypothetical protein
MTKIKTVWQKLIKTAANNYQDNMVDSLYVAKDKINCGDEPLSDAFAILAITARNLKDTKLQRATLHDIETQTPDRLQDLIEMALSYDKKSKEFKLNI